MSVQDVLQQLPVPLPGQAPAEVPAQPRLLLRNEHSLMGRETRNVWQLWLEAKALFTEICALVLLMFSFRSLGQ